VNRTFALVGRVAGRSAAWRWRRASGARKRLLDAEAKYRTLVEQLPLVTYIDALTSTASGIFASPQIEELLGYTADEWISDPEIFAKVLHPADRGRVLALVDQCNRTGEPFRSEYRLIRRDGRIVWVQDESRVVRDDDGRPLFTQGYLLDVTERKEAEQRLLAEQGAARVLGESTTVTEAGSRLVEVVCDALGWELGTLWLLDRERRVLRAGNAMRLLDQASAARAWRSRSPVWEASGTGLLTVPVLLGSELLGVLEFEGLRKPDENLLLAVTVVASQLAQFVERRRAETELWHQALHDALTGLPNRTLFRDRVGQALERSRRSGTQQAVLVMDLDRFKEVNDTLGHDTGDRLLHELGRRLQSSMRAVDTVARLGGDEFGFLLSDVEAAQAAELAARIQRELQQPFAVGGLLLHVEASIGIALFPEHGEKVDRLLQRADVAMYVAKRTGSGFALYDVRHDENTPARLSVVSDLRQALGSGELRVYYQPQVELAGGRVSGLEALLRWQHPRHGLLHPDGFLPAAERSGLMGLLTRHVIEEALGELQTEPLLGPRLPVAVNASILNLLDPAFATDVLALLESTQTPPHLLSLEITEHTAVSDRALVDDTLARLSAHGVRLAIDDFGTGYSSLARLRRLPLHRIKIDKSFVAAMTSNPDDGAIVRSTIDLAHNLGLRVTAEGVATAAVYRELARLRCDTAQGYYIGEAMPLSELADWVGRWRKPTPAGPARRRASA
jgi:diguanylate cyclase (GGDEF)-like protein/PAS domain S-box-containing protein